MKNLFLLLLVSLLALMSTVYFVSCSENDFGVNFVVDGEDYASISINGNDDVNMPADPTKEGYIFDGWYFDEGVWQAPFAAEQLINGYLSDSMTVYAKWVESHIHIPSEWIIDSEATCKEPGKKHTECTECGAIVENAIIEKSEEHVVVVDPRVEPTDTSNGLTEGSHCGVCGKVLVAQTVISAQLQGAEIASSSLTVADEKISGSLGNSMASFSFMNDISVAPGASYIVASDEKFKNTIDDKIASLEIGDNVFYILVTNGSTSKSYTVVIRRLPTYTVRFVTAGGTAVRSQTVEEGSLATAPVTSRTGYTFKGWNFDFTTKITEDITVEASWEANTDTVYKVEYYLENMHKTGYEYPIVENFSGTTASTVTAELKEFKHFKFNEAISVTSGSVNADGSLVLKVYYLRDTYGIDALVNDDARGTVEGGGTYAYGKEITLIATDKPGYIFLGWFEGDFTVCRDAEFTFKVEGDASYTAKWTEDTNTLYTVEYYLENAKKTDFDAPIVQVMAGTTNALVTAEQKEFEHFTFLDTAENVLSGNIDANGNLVLKVYYTRDTYDIAVSVNDSDRGTAFGAGNYIYGETVTLTATDKRGYTFLGWFDEQGNAVKNAGDAVRENNTYPYTYSWTFEADSSVSCIAKWDLSTDTSYTVEYYLENSDKSGYPVIADQTEMLTGTTFDKVTAEIKEFEHFTFADISSNVLDGTIAPEGNLVLKIYYSRNTYDVSASVDEEKHGAITGAGTFAYDQKITLTATPNPGYEFDGWYEGDDLVCDTAEYTFSANGPVNCIAKFKFDLYLEAKFYFSDEDGWTIEGVKDISSTEIVIPAYITKIGAGAFQGCTSLESIIVPDSVTAIGKEAFKDCTSLSNAVIGSQVKAISDGMFSGCTSLTGVTISQPEKVTFIGKNAFKECESLEYVNVGESVTSIGGNAFKNCKKLYSVTLSKDLDEIGNDAFLGCTGIKEVNISSIEDWCSLNFYNSPTMSPLYSGRGNLYIDGQLVTELIIPDSITKIGEFAFAGCSSITSLTVPSTVVSIGKDAFVSCSGLKTVEIEQGGVESLPGGLFSGCADIEEMTLPFTGTKVSSKLGSIFGDTPYNGGVKTTQYNTGGLGTYFYIPKELKKVTITGVNIIDGKAQIGVGAFSGCATVTSVTLPEGVEVIGDHAFDGCLALNSIKLPASVTEIGQYAFQNCASLVNVEIPASDDTDIKICSYAFHECASLASIEIPANVVEIGESAFESCDKLIEIINRSDIDIPSNDEKYSYANVHTGDSLLKETEDGYIFYTYDGVNYLYGYAGDKCEITIPASYNGEAYEIYRYAFANNKNITSVTIENGITAISERAFFGCTGLKSVVIPDSVETIGNRAFASCRSLRSVTIGNGVSTISDAAFHTCTSLTSIVIPDSVETIGADAFNCCSNLMSLTLGTGVTSIGSNAFGATKVVNAYGHCNKIVEIINHSSLVLEIGEANDNGGVARFTKEIHTGDTKIVNQDGYLFYSYDGVIYLLGYAGDDTELILPESFGGQPYVVYEYAFIDCDWLTSVTIPASIKIAPDMFHECTGLTSVIISHGIESIADSAFTGCTALVSIEIPSSVTSISSGAFKSCTSLESIVLPEGIVKIPVSAFESCTSLTSITIPNGVQSIGSYAFSGCTNLKDVTLPTSLKIIDRSAFYGCTALTSIDIPEGVTDIGDNAFYNSPNIEWIILPSTLTTLGNSVFGNYTALEHIYYTGDENGWRILKNKLDDNLNFKNITVECGYDRKSNDADSQVNP